MRLMIVDNDGDFRRRFSGYIASGCRDVSITAGGEEDGMEQLFPSQDLILCDEKVSLPFREALLASGTRCRWLMRAQDEGGMFQGDPSGIYKYQSACEILRSIPELYEQAAVAGLFARQPKQSLLIGVSGFSGGCGRTSFAVTLGRLLRQRTGQGVLLLSMKPVSDLYDYFPQDTRSAADMNLLLLNYASATRVNAGAFLISDAFGVSVIRPPAHLVSDAASLSAAELQGFLSYVGQWNQFQTIIIDMEELLDEAHRSIYEKADHIFVIHDDRRHPAGVEEEWFQKVRDAAGETPVRRILNYDDSGAVAERIFFDEESLRPEKLWDSFLPVDPDSFFLKDGRNEISMSGAFSAAVSAICKGLMQEWK